MGEGRSLQDRSVDLVPSKTYLSNAILATSSVNFTLKFSWIIFRKYSASFAHAFQLMRAILKVPLIIVAVFVVLFLIIDLVRPKEA